MDRGPESDTRSQLCPGLSVKSRSRSLRQQPLGLSPGRRQSGLGNRSLFDENIYIELARFSAGRGSCRQFSFREWRLACFASVNTAGLDDPGTGRMGNISLWPRREC